MRPVEITALVPALPATVTEAALRPVAWYPVRMSDKATFIQVYQTKARENLREAKDCFASGLGRAAISRAYYALYQVTNAWIAHKAADAGFDPDWPNAHHEDVERRWRTILHEIHEDHRIENDFDGDRIYGRLKSLRVRVDYKPRLDPTMRDAETAVSDSERAVGWLLAALKKAGR
jgi:uncharacterized protein (UPF0332 family)